MAAGGPGAVPDGRWRACARCWSTCAERGLRPDEPEPPSGPAEEAIAEYASYLRSERGLAAGTIETETALIRPFLAGRVREGLQDLESLTAADVQAFILERARSLSPSRVQRTGTALRSLLRFLHLQGVTAPRWQAPCRRRRTGSCPAFPGT